MDDCWKVLSNCKEFTPALFYPKFLTDNEQAPFNYNGKDRMIKNQIKEAVSICDGTHPNVTHSCWVKGKCLAFALANKEKYGVWGGVYIPNYTRTQRRKLQSERNNNGRLEEARSSEETKKATPAA